MKCCVSIDSYCYSAKPKGAEIPQIKKRTASSWKSYDLKEAAQLVGEQGCAMIPAHLEGGIKSENCTGMQLFVLDFDGGVTFRDIKEKCIKNDLQISFAYHTFSSDQSCEKFRIVFVHNEVIKDIFIINFIIRSLLKIFPEADQSCKDMGRMFFGGKELIHYDGNARLTLVKLTTALLKSLDNNRNFQRNLETFARETRLYLINGKSPAMGPLELKDTFFDENTDRAVIHIQADTPISSFCICQLDDIHPGKTRKKEIKTRRVELDGDTGCQMLDDFISGNSLSHNQKFAILTNLKFISGGVKRFFEVIINTEGQAELDRWKYNLKYCAHYHPMSCSEEICPYYSVCNHINNIYTTISHSRKISVEEEQLYSLEEAHEQMVSNLKKAISSPEDGIHLIRAQTALGKTHAYETVVSKSSEKFIIAVPTLILRKEVYKKLLTMGLTENEIFLTASIDDTPIIDESLKGQVRCNHQHGDHNIKTPVSEYMKNNGIDDPETYIYKEYNKIVKGNAAYHGERIVLATHSSLLHMKKEFFTGFTVIIDEDILMLQIFKRIPEISIECLEKLSSLNIPGYSTLAGRILSAETGRYYRTGRTSLGDLTDEQLSEIEYFSETDDVLDLKYAEAFVKYQTRDGTVSCHYFCPDTLKGNKYIVMSGTLNADIYRQYFRNFRIIDYAEKKATYAGTLRQFTYHSLGRSSIRKILNEETGVTTFHWITQMAGRLLHKENFPIISFKSMGKLNEADIHFGNSSGLNSLEGKDLAIIGTPFEIDFHYKLIACHMGADVNQSKDTSPVPRRVFFQGKSFVFQTYQNDLLRTLQLYSVESELEQCIGRARLLRCRATVYLFSSFPCSQARLDQKNYLLNETFS